jgi:exodeoxyribonuclease V alpha subunit
MGGGIMMESAAQWFESAFLDELRIPADQDVQSIMRQLVRAAINQHSCLALEKPSAELLDKLRAVPAIGSPGDSQPVILADNRLYLARYFNYELEIAEKLSEMNQASTDINPEELAPLLTDHFGSLNGDRQKLVALLALTRRLTIITGGPGTGKTSTVSKILSILKQTDPDLVIRLAAPTGKAAMRLSDSLRAHAPDLAEEVKTLHRLLGVRSDGTSFRHHRGNPLHADLLIIDEASMIDLAMMHRLLAALPDHIRLILLGDPDQLPSVDTGNVLADICAGDSGLSADLAAQYQPLIGEVPVSEAPNKLTDAICRLNRSYRFPEDSDIGRLARAVQSGDSTLSSIGDGSVSVVTAPHDVQPSDYWTDYLQLMQSKKSGPGDLISSFNTRRILCSRRTGDFGVESINSEIENQLERHGLKQPGNTFYRGRPVMITRNDYHLGLFNGDTGICMPAGEEGLYVAVFSDGREIPVSRLPVHETCFAMTVHKSQGSEHVILILADESNMEAENLMTRQLLYTAVTRSKLAFTVHTTELRWQQAIARSAARASGMIAFLRP